MVPVNTLQIVGYADVLTSDNVPSIVPPVFQHLTNPDQFYFPPFSIKEDMLCDPTLSTPDDFKNLIRVGKITGFFDDPIPAEPDFELWIDEEMTPRYGRIVEVHETLKELSAGYRAMAEKRIEENRINSAEKWCNKAISAYGNNIEPWAIKAGIRLFRGKKDNVDLLAKTISHICPEDIFLMIAQGFENTIRTARGKTGSVQGTSPMSDMARETDVETEALFIEAA